MRRTVVCLAAVAASACGGKAVEGDRLGDRLSQDEPAPTAGAQDEPEPSGTAGERDEPQPSGTAGDPENLVPSGIAGEQDEPDPSGTAGEPAGSPQTGSSSAVDPPATESAEVEECWDVCAYGGALCAIGDESQDECAGNCSRDVRARSRACRDAYLPLLECMAVVLATPDCNYYAIRDLVATCPTEVDAFFEVCEVGEHSLTSVLRPTLTCTGGVSLSEGSDGCSLDIQGCSDGNDYGVSCETRPAGDLRCTCLVGGEEAQTFASGGLDVNAFCAEDIGLDYCGFPFLDTGGGDERR